MPVALLIAAGLNLGAALAGPVDRVEYADLAREMTGRVDFEYLPQRGEPGFNIDRVIETPHLRLGERLAGQQVVAVPQPGDGAHDGLSTPGASQPLAVLPGPTGRNLSIAYHRGFGSNALFALGPAGFPDRAGRGEGAATILFARDTGAFGLKVHSDYADPLGARPPPGAVTLTFLDRTGAVLDRHRIELAVGVNALGFRAGAGRPGIAAVSVTNDDPGGIAIDDILFAVSLLLG